MRVDEGIGMDAMEAQDNSTMGRSFNKLNSTSGGYNKTTTMLSEMMRSKKSNDITNSKAYKNKIIINSEKHIENDLQNFLNVSSAIYQNFKIEYLEIQKIGEYDNRESKIFMVIVFSYDKEGY